MKKTYKTNLPQSYNDIFETKIVSQIEDGKLITDVEVYEPKFGDVVRVELDGIYNYKRYYFICFYPKKNQIISKFFVTAGLDLEGSFKEGPGFGIGHAKKIIPATESEKQELFDKMKEKGFRWNNEKKCVEKIEEHFNPKDGDFLFTEEGNNAIFIFNGKVNGGRLGAYIAFYSDGDADASEDNFTEIEYCRYATDDEKEAFLERLASQHGLVWDEKEKKIKRWRAKEDGVYFTIDIRCGKLIPCYDNECGHNIDNKRYEQGNYFYTEEACQRAIKKIESVLKESSAV